MYKLMPCHHTHIQKLLLEDINRSNHMDPHFFASQDYAMSMFINGELMMSGGITPYWQDRCLLWTLFSKKSKKRFVSVMRGIKRYLDYIPFKRIEMPVDYGFEKGIRRAKLLGFEVECQRAREFFPGKDVHLLALIKD